MTAINVLLRDEQRLMMSDEKKYDVFLSYNSLDHAHVERIFNELQARKCSSFIDRWYLTPGHDWVEALERALQASRGVAVFLGPYQMGRWQQRERAWALDRAAGDENFPVIPVLLPGSEPPLGFLKQRMWIDLRDDPASKVQLDALAAAIRGERVDLESEPKPQAMICPYRGLLAFREEDAEFFFGRDAYLKQLVDLVQRETFVAVVGASGSGKSSLVSAGLVPKLRAHDDGPVWEIVRMVPHVDPLYSLAQALAPLIEPNLGGFDLEERLGKVANDLEQGKPSTPLWGLVNAVMRRQPGTQRLMLFVDQWEELYTSCEKTTRRERFIQELLETTSRKDSPLSVVLTVRGDFFYSEILRDRPLLDRVQGAELKLGPMNAAELRSVIEGPGKNVGLTFQDGLVDTILTEAGQEPGNLPLLEFALEELWKRREGVQLTHAGYEDLGRLPGQKDDAAQADEGGPLSRAIATYAEGVYHSLTPDEKQSVPALFRKLVRAGAKTEDDTRRRVDISELDETARRVVRTLADKRLLITKGSGLGEMPSKEKVHDGEQAPAATDKSIGQQAASTTVEVAHEELLRRWGRLKAWVNEDRQFLLWRSRIDLKLEEFQRDGDAALIRGRSLQEAKRFYPARKTDLENNQSQFLEISLKAERRRRLGIWSSVCLAIVVLAAIGLGWYISNQRQKTDNLVESLLATPAGTVDFYLKQLEPFRELAVEKLRTELTNTERAPIQRVHAAYGLARFALDSDQVPFLLASIPDLPKDEGENLITALSTLREKFPDQLTKELKERIEGSSENEKTRNRLVAVAAEIGITELATPVCKLQNDPSQRTSFIHGFTDFPGDLNQVAALLSDETLPPETRSALCIAVGRLREDGKQFTQTVLEQLYQTAPDGGTHSAARWALTQQGFSEDELEKLILTRPRPAIQAGWQHLQNAAGLTMIEIPAREFALGSVTDDVGGGENSGWTGDPTASDEPVRFPVIWVSDREISVGQFQEILPKFRDTSEQNVSKVADLLRMPVRYVSWYDAIEFCNELSIKQGFEKPFYKFSDPEKIRRDLNGHITDAKVDYEKEGQHAYRLPTEIEWEYACRAMSAQGYCYGESTKHLREYVVFSPDEVSICGQKIPNAWGLFDMHGNVYEWCWDKYSADSDSRVLRGGSFYYLDPRYLRSAYRVRLTPDNRGHLGGYRISRTP